MEDAITRDPAATRVRTLAHLLDTIFRVPGTRIRFGMDPLIGLVPGVGDVVGGILSSYIILEAVRARASRPVLLRMLGNMGLDLLFAAVPLVGDLFDVGWRANVRNLELLRRHLTHPDETAAASKGFLLVFALAVAAVVIAGAVVAFLILRWLADAIGIPTL